MRNLETEKIVKKKFFMIIFNSIDLSNVIQFSVEKNTRYSCINYGGKAARPSRILDS